jgi:hypothetical protein
MYWQFIPLFEAAVVCDAVSSWSTSCWVNVTASAVESDSELTITISASDRIGTFDCRDLYLMATVEGFHVLEVATERDHIIHWSFENATLDDLSWVHRNGVRIFRFKDDAALTLDALLQTVHCSRSPSLASLCVTFQCVGCVV